MLYDYDKSERAQMERDARNKQELEYYTRLNADLKEAKEAARAEGLAEGKAKGLAEGKAKGLAEGKAEGLAEGKAKGLAEGKAEGIASMVKNMYDSGMKKEDIAKICKLDLVFVNEVLKSE